MTLLADLILVVHALFVAFVVSGLLLTLAGGVLQWRWIRNRWFRSIHLICIGVVVLQSWFGMFCPLTSWEHELRLAAGEQGYELGFIAAWLRRVMFFEAPPWVFTLTYTLFGALVVATWIGLPPRFRRAYPSDGG